MTSHFYIPYAGNKNREMPEILPKLNFENVGIVVEPYGGTGAMSYHIWTKNKDKPLRYVINDFDPFIFELYNIAKDPEKIEKIEQKISDMIKEFNKFETMETRKAWYDSLKKENIFENRLFLNKYYQIRANLCPTMTYRPRLPEGFKFSSFPFFEFAKNANVEFTNKDGIEIYDEYRTNSEALILLDPPYLLSEITFYQNSSGIKIYEHLAENDIKKEKAKIYLIVELTWIMKLLFKNTLIYQYPKKYENKHTKTIHGIFSNIN